MPQVEVRDLSGDPRLFLSPGARFAPVPTLTDAVIRYQMARHCQVSRPRYARCVGGAAARVGRSFLTYCAAPLQPSGAAQRRPGSVKLTMPVARLHADHFRAVAPMAAGLVAFAIMFGMCGARLN